MSFTSDFVTSNEVIVKEENLFQSHFNYFSENNWNQVPQQTQSYQQILQSLQQTQETSWNFNTQPPFQNPIPVYENVIEDIAYTSDYQKLNANYNPHVYYSQPGNCQALLQHKPMMSNTTNQIHTGNHFDNTSPRPYRPQTNYVNTKADLKGVTKRKRKRTMFTTEQVAVLEKVFQSKPYINRDERQALMEELQINERVIKVWFQNRRLKEKREAEEAEQELYSPVAEVTETKNQYDELSKYIQSQINHTDKFGFVTLDDKAINGLVKIIDNLLPKEVELLEESRANDVTTPLQEESEGSTIYEPISPASSDCSTSELSSNFEAFEPKESLQRIFDIQEFLIFNKKTV